MLALPQEYLGSTCELKTLKNKFLSVGVIIKIDDEALEIAAKEGGYMPLMQFRSVVKIVVHNSKMGLVTLAGVAYLSTENFARIEEVKTLNQFERRGAFRIDVIRPAKLYPVLSDEEQERFDMEIMMMTPEEATNAMESIAIDAHVIDLSLTGIRIQPATPLDKGDKYIIEFTPVETPMRFNIVIHRELINHNNELQYGCQFYGTRERQMDRLCKDLFQLQREDKRRSQKSL